jgi:hypothetical protein
MVMVTPTTENNTQHPSAYTGNAIAITDCRLNTITIRSVHGVAVAAVASLVPGHNGQVINTGVRLTKGLELGMRFWGTEVLDWSWGTRFWFGLGDEVWGCGETTGDTRRNNRRC